LQDALIHPTPVVARQDPQLAGLIRQQQLYVLGATWLHSLGVVASRWHPSRRSLPFAAGTRWLGYSGLARVFLLWALCRLIGEFRLVAQLARLIARAKVCSKGQGKIDERPQ